MRNKKTLVAVLGILGILIATFGVTYAFYSYSGTGAKINKIKSGSINFLYTESSQGISINDAMPMTDTEGKGQSNYFEFTVQAKTSSTVDVPYDITVRRSGTGENMDSVVNVYLTKVDVVDNEEVETPVTLTNNSLVSKFTQLSPYTNNSINIPANEKLLFRGTVLAGNQNYNQKYRLRMWVDTSANYVTQTQVAAHCIEDTSNETVTTIPEVGEANQTNCTNTEGYTWIPADVESSYPYEGKTYTLKVNVYGKGNEISQNTVELRKNTNISSISFSDSNDNFTLENGVYTSEAVMPEGETTMTKTIVVETENPNATVTVQKVQSPTSMNIEKSKTKKLSTSVQLENLTVGENNYILTVTGEDGQTTHQFNISITVLNGIPVSFATDDWEIIKAAARSKNSHALDTYYNEMGVTRPVTLTFVENGVSREEIHYLRVANTTPCINNETSETACGLVIEFADILKNENMYFSPDATNNNTYYGYPFKKSMYDYVTSTVYESLPNSIKQAIIPTTVISGHGQNDVCANCEESITARGYLCARRDSNSNFITLDKVYLLSREEVFGDNYYDTAASTTKQLDYYKNSNNSKIKTIKENNMDTAMEWWLRTTIGYLDRAFFTVSDTGTASANSPIEYAGISPAFRIG